MFTGIIKKNGIVKKIISNKKEIIWDGDKEKNKTEVPSASNG